MSKLASQAAQEYAAKKKASLERAAKIKEDRMRGGDEDAEEEAAPSRTSSNGNLPQLSRPPPQQLQQQQPLPKIRSDAEYSSAKYGNQQQQQQQPVYSNNQRSAAVNSPTRKGPLVKKAPWETKEGNPSLSLLKAKHGAKLAPAANPSPSPSTSSSRTNTRPTSTINPVQQQQPPPRQQPPRQPQQQQPPPQQQPSRQQQQQPPPRQQPPRQQPQYQQPKEEEEEEYDVVPPKASYPQAYDDDGGDNADLVPCPDCGRKFKEDRLPKHQKACKKVFLQKRKQFNSTAARVEGTDAAKFVGKIKSDKQQQQKQGQQPKKNAKWKIEHEQFMNAIRAARGPEPSKGGGSADAPASAPAPFIDPTHVQCPHCERRFNAIAADRHIPVCKTQKSKPSRLQKGGGVNASNSRNAKDATPEKAAPPQRASATMKAPASSTGNAKAPAGNTGNGLRSNNTRR